jgi:hypothetical protein
MMRNEQEKIEADEYGDEWRCVCGNRPWEEGFYPINDGMEIVQPAPEEWRTNEYVCDRCGRVINADTLVVSRRVDPKAVIRDRADRLPQDQ